MRWPLVLAIFPLVLIAQKPASADIYPCTEQGVLSAIEAGGGPHSFDCPGPRTVVTTDTLVIESDVILDGGGDLTLSGGNDHRVLRIGINVTAELRNLDITNGLVDLDDPLLGGGGGSTTRGTLPWSTAAYSRTPCSRGAAAASTITATSLPPAVVE